jgi:hypothetical protein
MPIYKTLTKKEIGPIIDPELENELDNETLDTQLNMLKQLNQRNPSRKSLAQFNYLKELSRQRNEAWKDVKSPRIKTKRIHFGKNKTKEFYKALPTDIAAKPQKLKRSQTYGGKRNTRKNRTRKHRK